MPRSRCFLHSTDVAASPDVKSAMVALARFAHYWLGLLALICASLEGIVLAPTSARHPLKASYIGAECRH
jgi:hypothetical protein